MSKLERPSIDGILHKKVPKSNTPLNSGGDAWLLTL